jgi:3-phenylpropionate/cinnamic acid dioxygenase small subunit
MNFSDYHAIQNLIYRYSLHMDSGDFDAVGKLFARANLYLPGDATPAASNGAEFAALWRKWNRIYPDTGTPRTRHVVTNVLIEAEGPDRARAHSYFTVIQTAPDFPMQTICGGAYRDLFARDADGSWYFIERREDVDQFGDLSHHLTQPYTEANTQPATR